jgi:hypothetical protein
MDENRSTDPVTCAAGYTHDVTAINHFKDELHISENHVEGVESELPGGIPDPFQRRLLFHSRRT